MAKRRVTIHELRRILRRYGVDEDSSRGKGSHTLFFKQFDDGEFTYPIPTHGKDVNPAYVKGARRKFRLTSEDGVSDDEFFGSLAACADAGVTRLDSEDMPHGADIDGVKIINPFQA